MTEGQISATIRSVFGHMPVNPDIRPGELRDLIARRLGIDDGSDLLAMLVYVRQGQALWREGQEVNSLEPGDSASEGLPRDRTIDNVFVQYRWRVLIEVTDPDSGEAYTNVVVVDSGVPLTTQQVREQAVREASVLRGRDREYRPVSSVAPGWQVTTTITTAGRA